MTLKPASHRPLFLPAISLLSVAVLCLLPVNRAWIADIVGYYAQVPRQLRTMGYEDRLRARHYRSYAVIEYIGQSLRPGDIFLLPPPDYVRRHFDPIYWSWSEPKYFYYMLGRRPTATVDDPQADRATCTVIIDDRGRPSFLRIVGPSDLGRRQATFRE